MAKRLPRTLLPISAIEAERFKAGFSPRDPEQCWLWEKGKISTGYGECSVRGMVVLAHRVSWVLHHGREIPAGAVLRHSCDTPACVNPHHLEPGSQRQNQQDAHDRGRWSPPPTFHGEKHPMAKLTDAQALEIGLSDESSAVLSLRYGVGPCRINTLKRRHGRGVRAHFNRPAHGSGF